MSSVSWASALSTPRTFTIDGSDGQPGEITLLPRVRDRVRSGQRCITVHVLPLLADHVAAIDNPGWRRHAVGMLRMATVELREFPDERYIQGALRHVADHRREGRVRTSYNGEGIVGVGVVLDLGEQLWDYFFGAASPDAGDPS